VKNGTKTLDQIRSEACNTILVVASVLIFFGLVGSFARAIQYGWHPVLALHAILFGSVVITTLARHRLGLALRAGVIVAVPYLAALGGILAFGRGTGIVVFFVSACVLAGCFFSRRIAFGVVAWCLATICAIYVGALTGVITFEVNPMVFNMSPVSWLSYIIAMAIATLAPMIAISALLQHLDGERQRADDAAHARSDFLARMSHELRTPMAGIMGMAEVLGHTRLDGRQQNMISNLMRASRSLLATLNDLLDFSKFEIGPVHLDAQPFLIAETVHNACAPFELSAAQKGIALRVDVPHAANEAVVGDGFRVGQVIGNLVDNAVKFTARGAVTVQVRLNRQGESGYLFTCTVMDTGIGMNEADVARLFDPFEQADTSISRGHGGSGLGLPICRHLVEAMGGAIAVRSRVGEGSTFTITVPFAPLPEVRMVAKPALTKQGRVQQHSPLRLLVVDDDQDMRTLAEIMLPRFGHHLTLAADGSAAVQAAKAERFDCILMDMHMPGMNGLEAMHAIQAAEGHGRHTPMIALTADVVTEHVRVFLEAGADIVIPKPVDWDLLEMKLRQVTREHAAAE
jgi:signal transduction histidine kinase/CheY-like chemotaxis protein